MKQPVTVFIEYKINKDIIKLYEKNMKDVIRELQNLGATHLSWLKAADQENLYVESFTVHSISLYQSIKEKRTNPSHPIFGMLEECIEGGLKKLHCWAFEPLNVEEIH
ncbi:hypothetical protein WD019_08715 [Fictibacillus sp. Mic-4]|uniref:hypothetical protein n=1 Tax=Fictibacillus sp. Mic-4 TaxID=3132826 RepID=UPI003CF545E8